MRVHTVLVAPNYQRARLFAQDHLGLSVGAVDMGFVTVTDESDFDRVRGLGVGVSVHVLGNGCVDPKITALVVDYLRASGSEVKYYGHES